VDRLVVVGGIGAVAVSGAADDEEALLLELVPELVLVPVLVPVLVLVLVIVLSSILSVPVVIVALGSSEPGLRTVDDPSIEASGCAVTMERGSSVARSAGACAAAANALSYGALSSGQGACM
jgi:hypothetical protein